MTENRHGHSYADPYFSGIGLGLILLACFVILGRGLGVSGGLCYSPQMSDPLAILRERTAKADAKVLKFEKSLESAREELRDLSIALRVMSDIAGESAPTASTPAGSVAVAKRQSNIVALLGVGAENARPPAEIFKGYGLLEDEDISIDTFRTTIWRMADKPFVTDEGTFVVRRDDSGYWKELVQGDTTVAPKEIEPSSAIAVGSKPTGWGVQPPSPVSSNPPAGWPS